MDELGAARASDLEYGHGSKLWTYWTKGEGFAKWSAAVHKWTTLRDLLLKAGVPPRSADGLATNIIMATMPGYMKLAHAKEASAGRAAMADTKAKPYGDVTYADPKNGKYPIDTEAHARAAWSYINQAKNASVYPLNGVTLGEVKDRIKAACKKFGIDISGESAPSGRAEPAPLPFTRSFALQDISIQAGGDGRTVDAYATVFDTPAPIHDQDGDYIEIIDRHAFDRILQQVKPQPDKKSWRVGVFYNHGMTLHGTPSSQNSLPIGIPLEIKADEHGLFTRTRYSKGADIDRILEAINDGSLRAYSFSGAFRRSDPMPPRGGFRPDNRGNLRTVKRTESTLREYGPTPFPAYEEAAITAVRAEHLIQQLEHITERLRSGAPLDEETFAAGAPADRDLPPGDLHDVRSARSVKQEMQAARSAFLQRYRR